MFVLVFSLTKRKGKIEMEIMLNDYVVVLAYELPVPSMVNIDEGSYVVFYKVNLLGGVIEKLTLGQAKELYNKHVRGRSERISFWQYLKHAEVYESEEYNQIMRKRILAQLA